MTVQGKDGKYRQTIEGTTFAAEEDFPDLSENIRPTTSAAQWRTISEMTKVHGVTVETRIVLDAIYVKFTDGTEGSVRMKDGMFIQGS